MRLIDQAASGVRWNGLALLARVILQFASLAVLARILSPEDFGLMAMAVVFLQISHLFGDVGVGDAIIQRPHSTREQLSSLYWLNLAVGVGIFALLWFATPLIVRYYQEPGLSPVLRWASLVFAIAPVGQQFQNLLKRDLQFRYLGLLQMAESAAYGACAISLAVAGFGVMSLVWATLLRTALTAGVLFARTAREKALPLILFRWKDLEGFLRFGFFQMGERTFNYIANNVDYLIVGRYLGTEALGYYFIAYTLMRIPVTYLNPVVVSVAFPTFARVQDRHDLLRRGYAKMLHYLSVVSFPLMAGLLVTAPLFVSLLYGPRWLPAVAVIRIFCPLGVLKSLGNPLGSILMAKGRADLGFLMTAVALVAYPVANLIGVRWGIAGVAFSSLCVAGLVMQPINFYMRRYMIEMTWAEQWQAIVKPAWSTIAMLAAVVPIYYGTLFLEDDLLQLVLVTVAGGAVYSAMIWALDRSFVQEARAYLGGGNS